MFTTLNKNHHKVIEGNKRDSPFSKKIFRVNKRSYTMLAIQNKPDLHKPCPSIKIKTPIVPQ
jgi:hypothetical protein